MNVRNVLIAVGGIGLTALLVAAWRKQADDEVVVPPHEVNSRHGHTRVADVVEKTLHQHDGEDSPVVKAFAEALGKDAG